MIPRPEVYKVIDGERDYQDAGRGNAKRHEGAIANGVIRPMTPGEYLLCMEQCLSDARAAWYKPNGGVACLDPLRKVVALGVACMEHHGALRRVLPPA